MCVCVCVCVCDEVRAETENDRRNSKALININWQYFTNLLPLLCHVRLSFFIILCNNSKKGIICTLIVAAHKRQNACTSVLKVYICAT